MTLNDRYVDLIEEGFDLAVRIGRLSDSSLVARKLAPMRPVICASPGYLRERGIPKNPDDLRKHLCLCNSTNALVDEWRLVDRNGRPVMAQIKGRLRANNGDTLRIAALQGLGLVNLPTFFVGGDLQAGTLVSVLSDYMPQDAGIYAVYPHSRHLLPKVRAFVDFLAERIGPRPYWDLVE
jgi:DNA-binding transcriptional LysR family regulator